jgi:outer membrane protein TolC
VEVSKYAREAGGYDSWRAGVVLDIPLETSGKKKAAIEKNQAELIKTKADLELQRRRVRQAVLEIRNEIIALNVERESVIALMDYRDLYLDRSRAIYQMEVKADLGDAEAKMSDAILKVAQNKFAIALAWARMEALLGKTVYSGADLGAQSSEETKP